MRRPMRTGKRRSEAGTATDFPRSRKRTLASTLTLTATLAALGTSLGIDVNNLFAADLKPGEETIGPGIDATQYKATPKLKSTPKLKGTPPGSVQYKMKATPPESRQLKIDTKAAAGQGKLNTEVPSSGA